MNYHSYQFKPRFVKSAGMTKEAILPLVLPVLATLATAGFTGYDLYKAVNKFRKGEIAGGLGHLGLAGASLFSGGLSSAGFRVASKVAPTAARGLAQGAKAVEVPTILSRIPFAKHIPLLNKVPATKQVAPVGHIMDNNAMTVADTFRSIGTHLNHSPKGMLHQVADKLDDFTLKMKGLGDSWNNNRTFGSFLGAAYTGLNRTGTIRPFSLYTGSSLLLNQTIPSKGFAKFDSDKLIQDQTKQIQQLQSVPRHNPAPMPNFMPRPPAPTFKHLDHPGLNPAYVSTSPNPYGNSSGLDYSSMGLNSPGY